MNTNQMDLMERFLKLEILLRRRHMGPGRGFEARANPRRGQGRVLAILKMRPEITQKELGYLLDIRGQSLGELLLKLEKNGFITRSQSEEDRRIMNVKLTPEGAEAADKLEMNHDHSEDIFGCLSEEEQKTLSGYLDRLIESLQDGMGDVDFKDERRRHHHGPHHGRCRGFENEGECEEFEDHHPHGGHHRYRGHFHHRGPHPHEYFYAYGDDSCDEKFGPTEDYEGDGDNSKSDEKDK